MRLILLTILFISSFGQVHEMNFKTSSGDTLTIANDIIYFNKKPISKKIDGIIYNSKYDRIIEQSSTTLLFLEIDDKPNYNKLYAFKVTNQKAAKVIECVYNDKNQGLGPAPFTDMDKDGNIEIGGFGLTEFYDSDDSTYYNPSKFYEVSNGKVTFDSSLTKAMDIKFNGFYLHNPLDKDGNCCVVIKRPTKKSSR